MFVYWGARLSPSHGNRRWQQEAYISIWLRFAALTMLTKLLLASEGIPSKVAECIKSAPQKTLLPMTAINPFYLRGDYDGDGAFDYAVIVRNQNSGEKGVLICTAKRKTSLMGAGEDFKVMNGNSKLTHLAFDAWQVEDGEIKEFFGDGRIGGKPIGRRELIRIEKTDSAIGFLYWNGKQMALFPTGG